MYDFNIPQLTQQLATVRTSFGETGKTSVDKLENEDLQSLSLMLLRCLIRALPEDSPIKDPFTRLCSTILLNDLVLQRVKPLLKAALAEKPDYKEISDLVSTIIVTTPPQSNPTVSRLVNQDTPVTYSSAALQGSEQTTKLLEGRIFEEIGGCTYRNVKGYFEKYFEGRPWSADAEAVHKSIKEEYTNNEWSGLSGSPQQDQVLEWLFEFQTNHLSKAKRRYYTINGTSRLTGGEANRQIDLLVKHERGIPSDTNHSWEDIAVIGELKASDVGVKGPLIQLARYARDVFANQPTRRFLHAFTICGRTMEAWVFDRSGVYSAGSFDIHEEPERFIRILAGYLMMDEDELGLDTFVQRDGDSHCINIDWEDSAPQTLQLNVSVPLAISRSIVSRGTACYSAKAPDDDEFKYVAKFSWPAAERKSEVHFHRLARERGVKGLAGLVGCCQITSISDLRHGMTFPKPYSFQGTANALIISRKRPSADADAGAYRSSKRIMASCRRSSLRNEITLPEVECSSTTLPNPMAPPPVPNHDYNNRIFRCLVTYPAGRPIYRYKSILELLEALRDVIKAHRSLFIDGKILHRDISENNIIITPRTAESDFAGMLIDLDLATEVGSEPSGAPCRTGTMEFMAIDVLLGNCAHTYRHDLESLFYVLIWECARRPFEVTPVQLTYWYTGALFQIGVAKAHHMQAGFESILLPLFPQKFDCLKPLCRELRSILFPTNCYPYLTPEDPNDLYRPMINAFDKAIQELRKSGERPETPADEVGSVSSPGESGK